MPKYSLIEYLHVLLETRGLHQSVVSQDRCFPRYYHPYNKAAKAGAALPDRYSNAKYLWLPWETLVNEAKISVGK